MDPHQVIEQLRSRGDGIVAHLGDLVAARTENPPGDEHRAAAALCLGRLVGRM